MTSAEKLRAIRKSRKMTQTDMTKLVGINRSTLSHYENGHYKLSPNMRRWLANALEIDPQDLLDDIPKEYSNKILKMQLAALHDEAHQRVWRGIQSDQICPTCRRNDERKRKAYEDMPELWADDEAMPPPLPDLERCPIDTISDMLFHMLPEESQKIHISQDKLPVLNQYLVHIRHPWYKPDILSKQLDLVCKYRHGNRLCDSNPDACNNCPVTDIRNLMEIVKNDTTSEPQNGWLSTKPWSYKWGIHCAATEHTVEFDAHIRIPKGISIYEGLDVAMRWTKQFINPGVTVQLTDAFNVRTPDDCILLDCIGTNRQRFILEVPATDHPNVRPYVDAFIPTYLQNIKSYKLRRPRNDS